MPPCPAAHRPSHPVGIHFEWPPRRHARVKLAHAAGRRVARIDEGFAAFGDAAFIQFSKTRVAHEHFTTDLENGRVFVTDQFQRN